MRGHSEQYAKRSAQRLTKTEKGMCRQTSEERFRAFVAKEAVNQCVGGGKCIPCESREQPGVAGQQVNGAEYFRRQFSPVLSERPHELAPRLAILVESRFSISEIAFQSHCRPIVERVCQRGGRVDPFESIVAQRQ